ncbi:uncharacterized protein BCR38DRAFT_490574 [Pseudomassariella vexata]|uniref:Uncharacterized protein n=1 Tax=Pseudomassariella vexata TaxID=1141098 RepID=A0A1Y2DBP9_9PEZI|nr:uncharacterized protein BCR38DRAFT_490574 [Pseudomassariella vexata]ORY56691.1 hypothetical protein BCR38DRAFT_490574 [Pseudomassariella vexata]
MTPVASPSAFIYQNSCRPAPNLLEHRTSSALNTMNSQRAQTDDGGMDSQHAGHSGHADQPDTPLSTGPPDPETHLNSLSPPSFPRLTLCIRGAIQEVYNPYSLNDAPATPPHAVHHLPKQMDRPDQAAGRRVSNAPSMADSTCSQTISIYSSGSGHTQRTLAVVDAVHCICLEASKTYITSHETNKKVREPRNPRKPSTPTPLHPYPPLPSNPNYDHIPGISSNGTRRSRAHEQHQQNNGNGDKKRLSSAADLLFITQPTNSLLNNISSICSMLWAGSQCNRLSVLNVERQTVDDMARLLEWGETVAMPRDCNQWSLGQDEEEEILLWRVVSAGRNLVHWLGVPQGIRDMLIVEGEVQGRVYGGDGYGEGGGNGHGQGEF